ncbi:MAG: hypothetical protein MHMPM18_001965 [Marteilia pararefringens]
MMIENLSIFQLDSIRQILVAALKSITPNLNHVFQSIFAPAPLKLSRELFNYPGRIAACLCNSSPLEPPLQPPPPLLLLLPFARCRFLDLSRALQILSLSTRTGRRIGRQCEQSASSAYNCCAGQSCHLTLLSNILCVFVFAVAVAVVQIFRK